METKLYVKRKWLDKGVEYQMSTEPKEGFEESDLEKLAEEAVKKFGKKRNIKTLAMGFGYALARLQEHGECKVVYTYG